MRQRNLSQISLLVLALVSSTILLSPNISPARAQASDLVCVASSGTTNCPSSPPTFFGTVGQLVTIAVNVQGSPSFNGVDIAVKADPTIINGTSIDTIGNAFQSVGGMLFVAAECINNHPVVGNCTSQDGIGIVHYAATSNVMVTGGHIFNINYQITGSATTTITYQTGCSSTSNSNFCVTIVSGSTVVPENLQGASFTTGPPPPDFSIAANPNSLSISQGSCATSTIILSSVGGFNGTVTISSSVSPSGPVATLSPTSGNLTSGGSTTSTLSVCVPSSTPNGSYTVTVTGSSGTLSHAATVSVSVIGLPDFAIATYLPSTQIHRGTSTSFIIIFTSENNFGGTINLAATVSPFSRHAPTTQLSPTINLCSGCSTNTLLGINASHSTTPGTYTVTLTATSGSLSHSISVIVTVLQ